MCRGYRSVCWGAGAGGGGGAEEGGLTKWRRWAGEYDADRLTGLYQRSAGGGEFGSTLDFIVVMHIF